MPLLRRSYELWHELEDLDGRTLLYTTGNLEGGLADGAVFRGALHAAEMHDLPHEVLSGEKVARRWPGYRLPAETRVLFQPDGGFLASEDCILAHVRQAQAHGAEIHWRERVLEWGALDDGVWVRTDRGRYEARRLVVSAGSWAGKLVPELASFAVPERQVLAWLQPIRPERFRLGAFPVFYLQVEEGRYYGLPEWGIPGFKFGRYHHLEERVDPDTVDREPNERDERILREFADRYFPDACGPTVALKACLFTNTPDELFILDLHPAYPQVAIAAGFSGHGYKFCSVVGEIMADFAQHGETRHDVSLFGLARFPP